MVYEDQGMGATGSNSMNGFFKIPTLRNVALTYPYMHDGRFATLMDVVNHYSEGIQNHPNLSGELKIGNQPRQMNFTQEEKEALVAFLQTYTDEDFIADVKYSDPFKQ